MATDCTAYTDSDINALLIYFIAPSVFVFKISVTCEIRGHIKGRTAPLGFSGHFYSHGLHGLHGFGQGEFLTEIGVSPKSV
jgi:hypothetical protein